MQPEKFQIVRTNRVFSLGFMFVHTHGIVKLNTWKAGKCVSKVNKKNLFGKSCKGNHLGPRIILSVFRQFYL